MKYAPVLSLIGTISGRQIQIENDRIDEKVIDINTIRSKDKSQSDVISRIQPTAVDVR